MRIPVLPSVDNTFSALVFFYDPVNKKVLFSNIPPDLFFGHKIDMEADFPFFGILETMNHNDRRRDWQTCLVLQEQQSHYFWFHQNLSEEAGVIFHFHAVGMRMSLGAPNGYAQQASSQGILFSVEKTPAGNVSAWMLESERLRKTLDRYKEEYTEFIDVAAHNLDAPLRKLGVLIERVTGKYRDGTDGEAESYIQRIDSCLGDMRSLIDSLAVLSRITSGGLKPEACTMETIVRAEWQELYQEVNVKHALLNLDSLPELEGDTAQYRQLFRQLLRNALRFAKGDQQPVIQIQGIAVNEKEKQWHGLRYDTAYFKIEIRDNGIGFRQEYAEKIFRPFLRLHGKSEYPGNGIGLALCKRIVENHRGIIYAESAENRGALFTLLLPQILN